MLLVPIPKRSGVCLVNAKWHRWMERSPWLLADHSKELPKTLFVDLLVNLDC